MANEWKKRVEKAGTSIFKFVVERVEDSLRNEKGEERYITRLELIQKLDRTGEELKRIAR